MCRSLGFAYVAAGVLQGITTINVYPWDILASAFLVSQNGGIVTQFNGYSWNLKSKSLVMAGNKKVHDMFIQLLEKYGLDKVK
jgi:fructose-1,6-bisphosphatase/inositol monophosphatase family enzyme